MATPPDNYPILSETVSNNATNETVLTSTQGGLDRTAFPPLTFTEALELFMWQKTGNYRRYSMIPDHRYSMWADQFTIIDKILGHDPAILGYRESLAGAMSGEICYDSSLPVQQILPSTLLLLAEIAGYTGKPQGIPTKVHEVWHRYYADGILNGPPEKPMSTTAEPGAFATATINGATTVTLEGSGRTGMALEVPTLVLNKDGLVFNFNPVVLGDRFKVLPKLDLTINGVVHHIPIEYLSMPDSKMMTFFIETDKLPEIVNGSWYKLTFTPDLSLHGVDSTELTFSSVILTPHNQNFENIQKMVALGYSEDEVNNFLTNPNLALPEGIVQRPPFKVVEPIQTTDDDWRDLHQQPLYQYTGTISDKSTVPDTIINPQEFSEDKWTELHPPLYQLDEEIINNK
jgi:hypothetical protein